MLMPKSNTPAADTWVKQCRRLPLRFNRSEVSSLTDSNTSSGSSFESFHRAGYYDLRAYTEPLSGGGYQGFVLIRHHTLTGLQQTTFRAGGREARQACAFASAELKVSKLKAMIAGGLSPMQPQRQVARLPSSGRGF
ncbi:MAG: hypothetical protein ACREYA_02550 [Cupriavidus necator]